ncbi:hemolysin family protein [Nesterenkonia populi]|uniref:hemolysin family protein n=1 Tax=Nesterenkonia populi TaxID=1591087 RepID=UPI0011BE34D0|nr:hemolysin family protein [Nesterenkonia populi]
MIITILILGALTAAALAFLLSTAEAAFIRLTRKEAEEIAEKHGSRAVHRILEEPVPHTLALQMWRWVLTTIAVVLITVTAVILMDDLVLGAIVAAVALTVSGFVSAAISPRKVGRAQHEFISAATARMVRGLRLSLGPIPQWLSAAGVRLFPGTAGGDQGFFDDDELLEYIARANESDVIEDAEAELIQSVFEMSSTRVRAVMVPRTDMVTIDADATLDEAMTLFLRSGHSRVPVIRGSADDITGMIYLKDVAYLEHMLRIGRAPEHFSSRGPETILAEELQRDVRYVPESKSVGEFLSELQRETTHVAVVIDEYGGTAGMVTMEDLIEELVGEIVDEYDHEDAEVEPLEDGRLRLSARMSIDDFADAFGIDLEDEEDVDTVGGLLAKHLGRVPIAGSEVEITRRNSTTVVLHADRLTGRRNRVSHVLAWESEGRRGARGAVGTEDEQAALNDDEPEESDSVTESEAAR